ncbi:glycosyltransferase [Fundidesulfovibrio butyratiphilus]
MAGPDGSGHGCHARPRSVSDTPAPGGAADATGAPAGEGSAFSRRGSTGGQEIPSGVWPVAVLPEPLRSGLLHGCEGAAHMAECARLAGREGLSSLAWRLAGFAWSFDPLRPALASDVTGADPVGHALARHVLKHFRPPADQAYYRRLALRREPDKIFAYLAKQREKEPGNPHWIGLSLFHAAAEEDWDLALSLAGDLPEPLALLVGAGHDMLRGRPESALDGYRRLAGLWEAPGLDWRAGLALAALGDARGAVRSLRRELTANPWNVSALLVLADLVLGRDRARACLPGSVSILLYSFRKPRDLRRTLESLAVSDLDRAAATWRVTVLDNGSGDETGRVLSDFAERLGTERFHAERLPVNVGAPAARNWLASLPHVRASDFALYLDDDVELPRDWLSRLGAAVAAYPRAGVWGCLVKDHARPSRIQSADVFLDPRRDPEDQARFSLSSGHHQTLDQGQFARVRPCATVTGCCHLFRTAELIAGKGFDLRYSPSQYDDLDHDIRLLLADKPPVFQGHLAIGHFKSTGAQGQPGQALFDLGAANQYKLHHSYTPDQFARAARVADMAALKDGAWKWRVVAGEDAEGRGER